jgi:hypothetical protein
MTPSKPKLTLTAEPDREQDTSMAVQIESLSQDVKSLRDMFQAMAINVATLTQTLLGYEQKNQSEREYVRDQLEIVRSMQTRIQALELWKAEMDFLKRGLDALVDMQKRLTDLEKDKAQRDGSNKLFISLFLGGSSFVGFVITIIVMIVFKR